MRLLFLVALVTTAASAQSPDEPVHVLSTYHSANPGHDLDNVRADDVLAPQRQQEIIAMARTLATFRPTVIALLRDPRGTP